MKIIVLFHRGIKATDRKYFVLIRFDPPLRRDEPDRAGPRGQEHGAVGERSPFRDRL